MATPIATADTPGSVLLRRQRDGFRLLFVAGVVLGTIGLFAAQSDQPPLAIVWFRCVFGALSIGAWALLRGLGGELRLAAGTVVDVLAAAL
ncbi:MAG: hypothetical protein KDC48_21790, partial [Planctomycetes bacterium]|nr:hypothetical protein [Planctomycetota bacterium]